MKRYLWLFLVIVPAVFSQTSYQPSGSNLKAREWFQQARFGMFIHWGVYSVPAYAAVKVKDENPYAEWYWNSLTKGKEAKGPSGNGVLTWKFHQRVYGRDFSYFEFAPMFRAELYDPEQTR